MRLKGKASNKDVPIYLQVREEVRSKIEDGDYAPGCAIPSENELAETYGINRLTVRNAIDVLVSEGLLKRVRGRGVFVTGERTDVNLDFFGGFRNNTKEIHAEAAVKIISRFRRPAGMKVGSILGIDPQDEIYYIKRLNLMNGEPFELERVMLPVERVPQLDDIDLSVFSLYEVYGLCGITLAHDDETLDIVSLEARDARYLGVPAGSVAMLLSDVTRDDHGRPVECSASLEREDKCRFTVHF
jgi:GntR family transcriptional regulator